MKPFKQEKTFKYVYIQIYYELIKIKLETIFEIVLYL